MSAWLSVASPDHYPGNRVRSPTTAPVTTNAANTCQCFDLALVLALKRRKPSPSGCYRELLPRPRKTYTAESNPAATREVVAHSNRRPDPHPLPCSKCAQGGLTSTATAINARSCSRRGAVHHQSRVARRAEAPHQL